MRYDHYMKGYMADTFTLYFSKDDTKILIGEVLLNDEIRNIVIQEVEERNYSTFTKLQDGEVVLNVEVFGSCLLYTSPSPRDATLSRMPSSA